MICEIMNSRVGELHRCHGGIFGLPSFSNILILIGCIYNCVTDFGGHIMLCQNRPSTTLVVR